MAKKNNKKFTTILYVIVLIAVLFMFSTIAYSYYVKVIKPNKMTPEVKSFDMLLMFDKGNQINAHSLKNGWSESREFTIENFSTDTIGKYKIVLEVITPLSNIVDKDFVYTLESVSDSKDTSNKLVNVSETPIPVMTKELGSGMITPKSTHTYKISFKLNNSSVKYPNDNMFSCVIRLKTTN